MQPWETSDSKTDAKPWQQSESSLDSEKSTASPQSETMPPRQGRRSDRLTHDMTSSAATEDAALFAGRYLIGKLLGRGGMADVFVALDTLNDNQPIAIKVMRESFKNDASLLARFQREAKAMAAMSHPNIVQILDYGEDGEQPYIAMEYINGVTLSDYLKDHAPLANDDAVEKTSAILSAIAFAHQHQIIHRDLKPANILISTDNQVKITDFGIAKLIGETALTRTNSVLGSVQYLSPEQARGHDATPQSDLYAIGIMLFEMLTGHVPFDGEDTVTIALQHFQNKLPSIINTNPAVPQALENVAIRATAKKPSNRYPDAAAMTEDLSTANSSERRGEAKLILPDDEEKVDTQATVRLPEKDLAPVMTPLDETPKPDKPTTFTPLPGKRFEDAKLKKKKNDKTIPLIAIGSLVAVVIAVIVVIVVVNASPNHHAVSKVSSSSTSSSSSQPKKSQPSSSKAPKTAVVPDVTGQDENSARSILENAGFKVGSVSQDYSNDVPSGSVISMSPPANVTLKKGSTISLTVSKGVKKVTVPDLKGDTVSEAKSELDALGLDCDPEFDQPTTNQEDDGKVYSYDPSGSVDPQSTTVTLHVYQYQAPQGGNNGEGAGNQNNGNAQGTSPGSSNTENPPGTN